MKKLFSVILLFFLINLNTSAQSIITGKVLSYNGKPLKRADVFIIPPMSLKVYNSVKADKNGHYFIKINKRGYYFVEFSGVDHEHTDVPVLINKTKKIELNVRLKHNQYVNSFKDVQIIGDFNNFNSNAPVNMKRQLDGTFRAEFNTHNKNFAYQLMGIEKTGRIINGTDANRYIYDGGGDYESVVIPKNGKVTITFNPKKLVRVHNDKSITFGSRNKFDQEAYKIITDMGKRQKQASIMHGLDSGNLDSNSDLSTIIRKLQTRINNEKNPELKDLLMVSYIELGIFGEKNINASIIKQAFQTIKPSSILWSIDPRILQLSFGFSTFNGIPQYLDGVISSNPDKEVIAFSLYIKSMRAEYVGNQKMANKLYNKLKREYGKTHFGKIAKETPINPENSRKSK